MRKLLLLLALCAPLSYADDWGGAVSPITTMYVYPGYAVVVQGGAPNYAGTAACNNNNAWSFSWSDFDEATAQRVYSALLAARIAQKPFRPVFSGTVCGPEGHKKFIGYFEI